MQILGSRVFWQVLEKQFEIFSAIFLLVMLLVALRSGKLDLILLPASV
jgi:hypothetical protein